jgi:60 kDa SS-A/Ro ribonucleoprotein
MAIQSIFGSKRGKHVAAATSRNHAGAPAYALDARAALAQLAATGTFGQTFYVNGEEQLEEVLRHASACEPRYIAQVAIYARKRGFMKDMPAVLLAHLATRGAEGIAHMERAFPLAIDDGRMLRNFVQVLRSGALGRKSLGTAPKRAVRRWLAARPAPKLLLDAIGNDPSLADVVKMVHPAPANDEQRAMFGYLLRKKHDAEKLPAIVRELDAFRAGERDAGVPKVPFRLLDSLALSKQDWIAIAKRASWQETRMNLNTYARHGVLEDADTVELLAQRLASAEAVHGAKAFPYQLLMAWKAAKDVPPSIAAALGDAMEHAVHNVPAISSELAVCVDVSGSMSAPVTGVRHGATSAVRCVDAAALIAAALMRKNPSARVLPFENTVRDVRLNPRDSITTLASQLAGLNGGGTNCSAPLARLNRDRAKVDVVVFVSDNESWIDAGHGASGTGVMHEWEALRARNPHAKLVCIDLTPNVHKQAPDRTDILNVGGFSDAVFDVVSDFVATDRGAQTWVSVIEQVEL